VSTREDVILASLPHDDRPFCVSIWFYGIFGKRFPSGAVRERISILMPGGQPLDPNAETDREGVRVPSRNLIQRERASLHLSSSGSGDFWVIKEVLMKWLNPWD